MSNILQSRATLKASPGDVDRFGLYPSTNRSTGTAVAIDEVALCDSGLSPSDTFHTARSSTRSFEIATEKNGRKLMSEEEVSDLVHNALRRARLATGGMSAEERPTRHMSLSPRKTPFSPSPTKQVMRRPFSFDEPIYESYTSSHQTRRVELPSRYENTGSSFGDTHEQYEDNLRPTLEKHMRNLSAEDSSESSFPSHNDRLSNANSGTSSVDTPADGTANSSDAIIRRVEEEIANARRAAHEANRRLAGVVDMLEPIRGSGFPELVSSSSMQKDIMLSSRYSSESSFQGDPSSKMASDSTNEPYDTFLFQHHKSSKRSDDRLVYRHHDVPYHKAEMLPDDNRDEESDGGRSNENEPAAMMLTSSIIEQRSSLETVDSSTRAKILLDEVLTGSTSDEDGPTAFEVGRPLELFDDPSFENPTIQSGHLFESRSFGKSSMGPSFDISINNPGQHNRLPLYSVDDDVNTQGSQQQFEEKVQPHVRSFEKGSMEPSFDISIDNSGQHSCPLQYLDDDNVGTQDRNELEERVEPLTNGSTSFHPQLSAQGNIIMRLLAQNDKQRNDEPPTKTCASGPEEVIDLTQVESDGISGNHGESPEDVPPASHPQFEDSSEDKPLEYKEDSTFVEIDAPDEDDVLAGKCIDVIELQEGINFVPLGSHSQVEAPHEDETLTGNSSEVIELQEGAKFVPLGHGHVEMDERQSDQLMSTLTSSSNRSFEKDVLEPGTDGNDAAILSIQIVSSMVTVADEKEQTIVSEEGIEILYDESTSKEAEHEDTLSIQDLDEHQIMEQKSPTEDNCSIADERQSECTEESRQPLVDEVDFDLMNPSVSSGEANVDCPMSDDKLETERAATAGDGDNAISVGLSVSVVSIESIVPSTTDENINEIPLSEAGETLFILENPAGDATLDFLDEPRPDPSEIEDDAITAVVANGKPGPTVDDRHPEFEKILDTAESEAEATSKSSTSPEESISTSGESIEAKQPPLRQAAGEEKDTTAALTRPRKVRFKQRYPVPPLFKKSRAPDDITRDHQVAHTACIPFLSKPKSDLRQLMAAAVGNALQRRSNACGALKVLTTQKKNKLMLVRTAGFLDALVFAATADIPRKHAESAIDARTRAVTAIFNVSEPKDNREIVFCHHGLIPALIKTIMDDRAEARMVACAALAILAKTVPNREPMAATEGLIAALVMLVVRNRTELDLSEAPTNTFSSEEDSDQESSCRRSYSSNSESSSSSVDHSSSDSQEDYEVTASPLPRAKSMRQQEREAREETKRRSQTNACATLLQLSKQCGAAAIMGQSDALLRALVKLSRQDDDPMHTKCIEILCNLTRFPANNESMAKFPGLVDSLVINGSSSESMDRIWSLRVLQNLSSHVDGKTVLANQVVLELLSFSIMRDDIEEQLAATATLYNLSTEPGAVVPLTNSKNVVATLVHVAHNPKSSSEVRLMACDALATLGLWLQTLAGAGTFPEAVDPNTTLPSYATTGWNRWD
jgi:hypothetical protein